ncbi:MAG TPA: hypothetical protein VGF67_26025 [Ktedonobacteraceae bacterium]|jgi:hypothetical protein
MFDTVSYRRGVIEGATIYTLGRLGALVTPTTFPDWVVVAGPVCFLLFQFLLAPFWSARRIKQSSKRERLSWRFWLLGPRLAAICLGIDIVLSLVAGLALYTFTGVQQGPVLAHLLSGGSSQPSLPDFALYELKSAIALFGFFTLTVVCTRLAQGGFLRFTMPSGGNRVTL